MGELSFLGIRWSTILSIAFCGIDFAGIARIFTPESGSEEPVEIWYLFGAWLLAAAMNAMLTWWGVSIALLNHTSMGNAVVEHTTLLKVVPIFIAILVWITRLLLIGSFSTAGERLFSQGKTRANQRPMLEQHRSNQIQPRGSNLQNGFSYGPTNSNASRGASFSSRPQPHSPTEPVYTPAEPEYHSISMNQKGGQNRNVRNLR